MDWIQRALCRDVDPDIFFPVGTSGPALEQAQRAKAICASCKVRAQCLDWALATGQDSGVWGGMDEEERREIRRARRRETAMLKIAG